MISSQIRRREILKAAAAAAVVTSLGARIGRAAAAPAHEQIDAVLRRAAEAGEVPGVVATAATDKWVFYEGAFGTRDLATGSAMTPDTIFRIASMTKAVTSVAAMQIVEQGKLQLEQPIGDVLPELSAPQVLEGFDDAGAPRLRPAKRPITLRDLLTHTAGFGYEAWDASLVRYVKVSGTPSTSTGKLASLRLPLVFDPGDRWEYGINMDWAGRAVEAVSGQPLEVYFREHIFTPLGISDTAYAITSAQQSRLVTVHQRKPDESLEPVAAPDPPWREFWSGGGGLNSTGRDYLVFLQMLLGQGRINGTQLLRPETVALMGRNQIGDHQRRDFEDGDAAALQRRRFLPRHPVQMGPRLYDQHAAGTERPQRRQPNLGRHLQHLLLARPAEACRRRDHDPDPAVRRPQGGQALRRIRERRLRCAEGGLTRSAQREACRLPKFDASLIRAMPPC
jgi:methyl acetate hydrolase